jgi:hypothetical protein
LNVCDHGVPLSVPIVVQLFAPAGLAAKTTWSAEPPVVAVSVMPPETLAPGLASETVGGVESTCTCTGAVVRVLPATSVAMRRRS